METIDRVETIPFSIPYAQSMRTSQAETTSADHVLIRLTDSDGATGCAEAIPRAVIHGETVGTVLAVYEELIRPLVVGQSIWDRERILTDVSARLVGNLAARSALDQALHDLFARRLGTSCHRLLGGFSESVLVTGHLTLGATDALVARALDQHERLGIVSFKVKIGTGVDHDITLLERLHEALPSAAFRVDANHAYTEMEAMRLAAATADLGPSWWEEPTRADGVVGREWLAKSGSVQILSDESTTTPAAVVREVLARRTHGVSIKVSRSGYLASDRIRIFCELTGTGVLVGTQGETGLGTLSSLAFAAAHQSTSSYPTELSAFCDLTDDLLVDRLEVRDGRLFVPKTPGNGAEIDHEKLDHYRTSR